jgi:hypothetical protein
LEHLEALVAELEGEGKKVADRDRKVDNFLERCYGKLFKL